MNERLYLWQPTKQDRKIYDIAVRYHDECEAYDRLVCTGPVREGSIMPATHHEMGLISRNAHAVLKRFEEEARQNGITRKELLDAIAKFSNKCPPSPSSSPDTERP